MSLRRTIVATLCALTYQAIMICCLIGCAYDPKRDGEPLRAMWERADAVAGPGSVIVTAPAAGQLTVNWSADPTAWKYYVFQSAAGGSFGFVASVLNASQLPPAPTSYTASGLSGGTQYCYEIQAVYTDGSMSDLGAPGCRAATGTQTESGSTMTLLLGGGNAVASNASVIRNQPDDVLTTGATVLFWTVPMRAGDRIRSGSLTVVGDGLVDITSLSIDVVSVTDVSTTLVSGSFNNVPAAFNNIPFLVTTPVPMGPTDRAVIRMVVNAGGLSAGLVAISYDHPG